MQVDPMEEWRRLTSLYSEMGDTEIRELAAQMSDLTETAQQVLRDELKRRGISEHPASLEFPGSSDSSAVHWERSEETAADTANDGTDEACDYTWKTALLRCDSLDEAAQRCEMLRRAGIGSWVQRPGSRFIVSWVDELGTGDIQINVAADQLEQARAIVSQPVPQDIIDDLKEEESASAYELPMCPRCGSVDPILESADPSNSWLCEVCGHAWSDPLVDSQKP